MSENVMDYLQIFFRRKQLFIYPFIVIFFMTVLLSFILPKTYVSRSVILIEEENVINPLISGLAVSTSVAERLRILRERILSWTALVELVKRLDMGKDVRSQLGYEKLIDDIRENIGVELRGPQLVMISYQGEDPIQVQQVVKNLTDIFIRHNVESQTKETDVAVKFLEEQLRLYRRKIKEDEIKRRQKELDGLLVDSTPDHPLVKNLQARISKLTNELEKDDTNVEFKPKQASQQEMLSLLLLKELGKGPNANAPAEADLPAFKKEDELSLKNISEGLTLDARVNEDIYGMLLRRLETARITRQLETFKEGTRFTIIDPPLLPLKPKKPDPVKFLLLGIVFGIAGGAGCIYLAEMFDHSFKNINDAKAYLKLPVFGSVSTIILDQEFNRRKQGARFIYVLIALCFFLVVAGVFIFSVVR
ncbi:MAG: hypothetical protein KJ893_07595 [Candidatus Omnitrophica bacterium]|nr:hypothetical protein [Candidatus Omnitrophota bacterium]MBU4479169.1 hypothetical protein [Candidatus Omnitrophota bacterium]MCG2703981.1 hypothetical protein [Candidatus Omnitrophota bacterium]